MLDGDSRYNSELGRVLFNDKKGQRLSVPNTTFPGNGVRAQNIDDTWYGPIGRVQVPLPQNRLTFDEPVVSEEGVAWFYDLYYDYFDNPSNSSAFEHGSPDAPIFFDWPDPPRFNLDSGGFWIDPNNPSRKVALGQLPRQGSDWTFGDLSGIYAYDTSTGSVTAYDINFPGITSVALTSPTEGQVSSEIYWVPGEPDLSDVPPTGIGGYVYNFDTGLIDRAVIGISGVFQPIGTDVVGTAGTTSQAGTLRFFPQDPSADGFFSWEYSWDRTILTVTERTIVGSYQQMIFCNSSEKKIVTFDFDGTKFYREDRSPDPREQATTWTVTNEGCTLRDYSSGSEVTKQVRSLPGVNLFIGPLMRDAVGLDVETLSVGDSITYDYTIVNAQPAYPNAQHINLWGPDYLTTGNFPRTQGQLIGSSNYANNILHYPTSLTFNTAQDTFLLNWLNSPTGVWGSIPGTGNKSALIKANVTSLNYEILADPLVYSLDFRRSVVGRYRILDFTIQITEIYGLAPTSFWYSAWVGTLFPRNSGITGMLIPDFGNINNINATAWHSPRNSVEASDEDYIDALLGSDGASYYSAQSYQFYNNYLWRLDNSQGFSLFNGDQDPIGFKTQTSTEPWASLGTDEGLIFVPRFQQIELGSPDPVDGAEVIFQFDAWEPFKVYAHTVNPPYPDIDVRDNNHMQVLSSFMKTQ